MKEYVPLNSQFGYWRFWLTPEEMQPIRQEVEEKMKSIQQKHFSAFVDLESVCLSENEEDISDFRLLKSRQFFEHCMQKFLPKPMKLVEFWVNFQKQTEFQSLHDHPGDYSFALYLQVPFRIEDENKLWEGKFMKDSSIGKFTFIHNGDDGLVKWTNVPVDQTYENTGILFPATLTHCVWPFYSSDKIRISVSGNFEEI